MRKIGVRANGARREAALYSAALVACVFAAAAQAAAPWDAPADPHALRLTQTLDDSACWVRLRATHATHATIAESSCRLTSPPAQGGMYLFRWSDLGASPLPALARALSADATRVVTGHVRGSPGPAQIVLHDLAAGTQTVLSRSPTGEPADDFVLDPFLAASGAAAVFSSSASNLPLPYPDPPQLLAWEAGTLAPLPQSASFVLAGSADGRVLALTNTSASYPFVLFDRLTGTAQTICANQFPGCFRGLSPDGRWIAYAPGDGTRVLRDRATGQESALPDDDPLADNAVLFDQSSQRALYGGPLGNGRATAYVRTLADGRERRVDIGDPGFSTPKPAAFGPGDAIAVTIDGASILTTTDVIQGDGFEF